MGKMIGKICVALLIMIGCIAAGTYVVKAFHKMPVSMPDDFAFEIHFGIGGRNEINTFNDTVTKDLISDGTATANMTFTPEEMEAIYNKMKDVNVAESKKLIPLYKGMAKMPFVEDRWYIRLNGKIISLTYSDKFGFTKDATQLFEIRNFIMETVKKKEEFKKLPEEKGCFA